MMEKEKQQLAITESLVTSKIYIVRDKKVMLDRDLAELYEVETRALNQAVSRNLARFPEEFMFQLSPGEFEILKCRSSNLPGSGLGKMSYIMTYRNVVSFEYNYVSYDYN